MERLIAERGFTHAPTEYMAGERDALTGLLTRSALQHRVGKFISGKEAKNSGVALLHVGLDGFKLINRNFGQHIGDLILSQTAERLQQVMHGAIALGRTGGDEFSVCLGEHANRDNIGAACGHISDAVRAPFAVGNQQIFLTCSIGIALQSPEDLGDLSALLNFADLALQQAKDIGGDTCCYVSTELIEQTRNHAKMVEALRIAIRTEQLHLRYQPLVDLQTGKICGMEALVRWTHAEEGEIPTRFFIDIAENSGLIVDVGNWVIRQACKDIRDWQDKGIDQCRVAINISPKQFQDASLAEEIASALRESQLSADMLCVEITEAVLVHDGSQATATLNKLMDLGISLILDDFGTGFSSLSYLKRLPFLKVKIDRSFVKNVPENGDDAAISKAVISMAHSLGMRVVAEGVETEAQCSFLSQNMCDEIQGYLFSDALGPG